MGGARKAVGGALSVLRNKDSETPAGFRNRTATVQERHCRFGQARHKPKPSPQGHGSFFQRVDPCPAGSLDFFSRSHRIQNPSPAVAEQPPNPRRQAAGIHLPSGQNESYLYSILVHLWILLTGADGVRPNPDSLSDKMAQNALSEGCRGPSREGLNPRLSDKSARGRT